MMERGSWPVGVAMTLAVIAGVAACGDGREPGSREVASGTARVGGRVVSTVEGEAVTVGDVSRVVRRTGLSPERALRRLQDRILLAREAERRGYGARRRVRAAARKAAVQALLERAIEREVTSSSIDEEQVREAFEQRRKELEQPERRRSVHVLARLPDDAPRAAEEAGRKVAEEALEAFRRANDPEEVLERYRGREGDGFEIVVEKLPAVHRGSSFAQPFLETLFEAEGTGPVDGPVRTEFGWHAVFVTEILPKRKGFEATHEELRAEMVTRGRHRRLVELLRELQSAREVVRHTARLRAVSRRGAATGAP